MPQVICWKMQPPSQLIVQLISKLHCYQFSFCWHFCNDHLTNQMPDPRGEYFKSCGHTIAELFLANIAKLPYS